MKFETQKLMRSAEAANKSKNFAKANTLYYKALGYEPDNLELRIQHAQSLFAIKEFIRSADHFHRLHTEYQDDLRILNGCAISYLNTGRFDLATLFLKKMVAKNPDDFQSWMNLCFAAGSTGQHSDCLFYAMQAMQLKPLDAKVHNNLGSVLLQLLRFKDALISFETALKLDPKNLDAMSNIATTLSKMGESKQALDVYEHCLVLANKDPEFQSAVKYRMSFDLFRTGQLEHGWKMYDFGFDPVDPRSRSPKRKFKAPLWNGKPLKNETLLIWREQGLGDELVFFGALKDAQQLAKKIIVECDGRLVPVLSRSFPDITFREQAYYGHPSMQSPFDDFDVQIPAGSLMGLFRNSIDDFRKTAAYVIPCPERKTDFMKRLESLSNRTKIGICWRSGILNTERNNYYTSISDWEQVLKFKNVDFINLQYGDCKEEVDNVAAHFGVTLHQWPDLNLKDDLEGVFALISCLDHVVTVDTAVSAMAPAVGTHTSVLVPDNSWFLFGSDEYLIFPGMTPHINAKNQALRDLIPSLASDLASRFSLE